MQPQNTYPNYGNPNSGLGMLPGFRPFPNPAAFPQAGYLPGQNFQMGMQPMPIISSPPHLNEVGSDYKPKAKFTGEECVFVGDIPKEVTETELRQFLSRPGTVRDLFYPLKDNGTARGFAFVKFDSVRLAIEARHILNNTKLREKEIRVLEMINPAKIDLEKNVVVKGIVDINQADLMKFFSQFGEIYSVKVDIERNEGFVQFKDKKFEELLKDTSFSDYLDGNKEQGYRLSMLDRKIIIEPYKKKKTLYFQNLPAAPDFDVQEFVKFIENNRRKVISVKTGYNENYKQSWTFLTFETYEQAQEVYEFLQQKKYKDGNNIEIFWPTKREKKTNYKDYKKLYTRTFHSHVNLIEAHRFFNQICLPEDDISIKIKTSNFIVDNVFQQKKNGTLFVKTQEGLDRIFNFFKDSKNEYIWQKLYEGEPFISLLVPFSVLKEFKEMKKKNLLVNSPPVYPPALSIPSGHNASLGGLPGFNRNQNQNPYHQHQYQQQHPHQYNNRPQNQHQQIPQQPKVTAKPVESLNTLAELRDHEAYKNADDAKKREILGSILFRKITSVFNNTELIPRITGMLIDASVFDIPEIEEYVDIEDVLKERIKEAVDLIEGKE